MLVYHPPSSSPTRNLEFVNLLTSYLECVLDFNSPVIVAEDMNLNLLDPKNLNYIDIYINNLFELNMMPVITRPTKVNLDCLTTRFSVLDQIWVSA